MENRSPVFFLLVLTLILGASVNAELTVHYIDVGQGDAELLQSGGHNMLIDAGPTSAGYAVVNYLKNKGVTSLDVVVSTHPHEDHIGGMVDILNTFTVGLYVDNGETHTSKTYEDVMSKLNKKQIPYAEVTSGKNIPFADGITVQVMGPSSLAGDLNEDSVVLKVTDGSEKFLFMGDAADASGDLSAQVLKVTHHGSNSGTSSSFVNKVNPEVAIIEVGSGNTYGHPTQRTISTLQSKSVKIYRTDELGSIIINSDGSKYSVDKGSSSSTMSFSNPKTIETAKPVYQPEVIPHVQEPIYQKPTQSEYSLPASPSSGAVCDCSHNSYNCGDFPLPGGVTADACYSYCQSQGKGDIHGLDRDKDGLACEG